MSIFRRGLYPRATSKALKCFSWETVVIERVFRYLEAMFRLILLNKGCKRLRVNF